MTGLKAGSMQTSRGPPMKFFQDLGAGSTACNLDPSGFVKACEAVERAMEDGADVVVLSKFGKLEAARADCATLSAG